MATDDANLGANAATVRRPIDSRLARDLQYLALRVGHVLEDPGATRLCMLGMGRRAGVSTLVVGLAEVLAVDRRVLLVDAGWQAPCLHRALAQPHAPGLQEVLAGGARVADVRYRVRENLTLVPSGAAGSAPAGSTDTWRKALADLGLPDELVLIDAGSVQLPAAVAIATAADATVLVVEAGRVKWDAVAATASRLAAFGVEVAGVVLNKRRFPVPGFFYGAR